MFAILASSPLWKIILEDVNQAVKTYEHKLTGLDLYACSRYDGGLYIMNMQHIKMVSFQFITEKKKSLFSLYFINQRDAEQGAVICALSNMTHRCPYSASQSALILYISYLLR